MSLNVIHGTPSPNTICLHFSSHSYIHVLSLTGKDGKLMYYCTLIDKSSLDFNHSLLSIQHHRPHKS